MEKNREKKRNPKAAKSRLRWARVVVQVVAFFAAPALFAQAFAGIREAIAALGSGSVLSWSGFTTRLIVLCALTVVFGRIFCGWLCAFGALGDWIYQFSQFLQKKTKKKLPSLPAPVLPYLQKLKYLVLLLVLLLCFFGQTQTVTRFSPWTVFSMLTAGNLALSDYVPALILLVLIVIGMAVQERFFCQFLCPMGAVFSLLPELPFLRLKRKKEACIPNCSACRKTCPVGIRLDENALQEGECICCGRCALQCPRRNIRLRKNHRSSDKTLTQTPERK